MTFVAVCRAFRSFARAAVLAIVAIVASVAASSPAAAGLEGDRFVLAWPPSFYDSAEIAIWSADGSPAEAWVRGPGIDEVVAVPAGGAARVPLPGEARCIEGVDACAVEVARVAGDSDLRVLLQTPATDGVPDTLVFTAHDAAAIPPAAGAGVEHVVVSWPTASEFPQGASFFTVVATGDEGAAVTVEGEVAGASACVFGRTERLVAGEAWTVRCDAADADLTGLRVLSDAPVVVLSGQVAAVVPHQPGSGLSADQLLGVLTPVESLPRQATHVVPPLPRGEAWAGRGDVVRIVAARESVVRVRDDSGRDETRTLAAGESWDLDTAGDAGADLALRLDSDGAVVAWQLSKSRAHRGSGDAAAIVLAPMAHAVSAAGRSAGGRVFVPDGYAEGTTLHLACEAGAAPLVDGAPVALLEAPGGGLRHGSVALDPVPSGGAVHGVEAVGCVGWTFGRGGFKAHGALAVAQRPDASVVVRRGTAPDELHELARTEEGAWIDAAPPPLAFYDVLADALLVVGACGDGACLSWEPPRVP